MMTRTMLAFAAAALLIGPAIAQAPRPNDKPVAERASPPAKPGETVYRLIDDPPSATTGFSTAPVVVMPPPGTEDGVVYSYGSARACSTFDFDHRLC
jgi:hypothetical protein